MAILRLIDCATFNASLDVLALFKTIKSIHITGTISKVDAVIAKAA